MSAGATPRNGPPTAHPLSRSLNGVTAGLPRGPSAYDLFTQEKQDAWLDGIQAKIARAMAGRDWRDERSPSPLRAASDAESESGSAASPAPVQHADGGLADALDRAADELDARDGSLFGSNEEEVEEDEEVVEDEGAENGHYHRQQGHVDDTVWRGIAAVATYEGRDDHEGEGAYDDGAYDDEYEYDDGADVDAEADAEGDAEAAMAPAPPSDDGVQYVGSSSEPEDQSERDAEEYSEEEGEYDEEGEYEEDVEMEEEAPAPPPGRTMLARHYDSVRDSRDSRDASDAEAEEYDSQQEVEEDEDEIENDENRPPTRDSSAQPSYPPAFIRSDSTQVAHLADEEEDQDQLDEDEDEGEEEEEQEEEGEEEEEEEPDEYGSQGRSLSEEEEPDEYANRAHAQVRRPSASTSQLATPQLSVPPLSGGTPRTPANTGLGTVNSPIALLSDSDDDDGDEEDEEEGEEDEDGENSGGYDSDVEPTREPSVDEERQVMEVDEEEEEYELQDTPQPSQAPSHTSFHAPPPAFDASIFPTGGLGMWDPMAAPAAGSSTGTVFPHDVLQSALESVFPVGPTAPMADATMGMPAVDPSFPIDPDLMAPPLGGFSHFEQHTIHTDGDTVHHTRYQAYVEDASDPDAPPEHVHYYQETYSRGDPIESINEPHPAAEEPAEPVVEEPEEPVVEEPEVEEPQPEVKQASDRDIEVEEVPDEDADQSPAPKPEDDPSLVVEEISETKAANGNIHEADAIETDDSHVSAAESVHADHTHLTVPQPVTRQASSERDELDSDTDGPEGEEGEEDEEDEEAPTPELIVHDGNTPEPEPQHADHHADVEVETASVMSVEHPAGEVERPTEIDEPIAEEPPLEVVEPTEVDEPATDAEEDAHKVDVGAAGDDHNDNEDDERDELDDDDEPVPRAADDDDVIVISSDDDDEGEEKEEEKSNTSTPEPEEDEPKAKTPTPEPEERQPEVEAVTPDETVPGDAAAGEPGAEPPAEGMDVDAEPPAIVINRGSSEEEVAEEVTKEASEEISVTVKQTIVEPESEPKESTPPSKEATPPPKEATPPPKEPTPPPKEPTPPPKEPTPPSKEATPPPKEPTPPPQEATPPPPKQPTPPPTEHRWRHNHGIARRAPTPEPAPAPSGSQSESQTGSQAPTARHRRNRSAQIFEPLGITTRSHCSPHKVYLQEGALNATVLVPGCRIPSLNALTKETSRDFGLAPKDLATDEALELSYYLHPLLLQKASRLFGLSTFHDDELFVLEHSEGAIEPEQTRTRRQSFSRSPAAPSPRDMTPRRGSSLGPGSETRRRRGASRASLGRSPAPDTTPTLTVPRLPSVTRRKRDSSASHADEVDPSPSKRVMSFTEPGTPRRYALRSLAESPAAPAVEEPSTPAAAGPSSPPTVDKGKGKAPASPVPASPVTRRVTRRMAEMEKQDETMDEDGEKEKQESVEEDEEDEDERAVDAMADEPKSEPDTDAIEVNDEPKSISTSTSSRRKRKLEPEPPSDDIEIEVATEGPTTRSSKRRAVASETNADVPEPAREEPAPAPARRGWRSWAGKLLRR